MSKKDGKATLVEGTVKKDIHVRAIHFSSYQTSIEVAAGCPARVIKVVD
jgi:hypothetical protein